MGTTHILSLFTPEPGLLSDTQAAKFQRHDEDRLALEITSSNRQLFAVLPEGKSDVIAIIKDEQTGLSVGVRRSPCGISCYCGAEIVGIVGENLRIVESEDDDLKVAIVHTRGGPQFAGIIWD